MEPITALIHALASLVANRLMDWFKSWTWLNEEERSRLAGPIADFVAWLVSAGAGLLLAWLGQAMGLLDPLNTSDLAAHAGWPIVGAQMLFLVRKVIEAIRSLFAR